MIADISAILWKEAKEIILQRPNFRGGWLGLLVLIGMFGIFLPLQSGPEWLTSPVNLAIWAWVPYLLVSGVVADSIAGERERHTLETLLASRLSDTAILFGKIAAAVLYGWGLTLISALVSMIVINLVHGHGRLLLFSLPIGVGVFVLSF
jgi:ABC-2 type transport system permease protein